MVGNSAPTVDAEQVFKSLLNTSINEYYSIAIDIERYQGVCIIKGRFLSRHRYIHASKQLELKHWKEEGIQQ